jgi:hypothetical protein
MPDVQQHAKIDAKELIKQQYIKCASDPVYFIKKYCYIQHQTKGKIKFELFPFQEDTLRDLRDHNYSIILKSRQLGISTLIAGYSLWLMTFYTDKNILIIATKKDVSQNLLTKVKLMWQELPSWLKLDSIVSNTTTLKLSNRSTIKAVPSTADAGRSEALSLLIVDEAAFIDNAEDIWTSAQQTLATSIGVDAKGPKAGAILLSTPNGTGNFFHRMWVDAEQNLNGFNTIKLKWDVHPERTQVWRDEQTKVLGYKKAAQECDASFISSGNTVIDSDILTWYTENTVKPPQHITGFDKNFWVWEEPNYHKEYMVVADVARGDSSDYSAFHVIDIDNMEQVAEYKGQMSTTDFGHFLVAVATQYNDAMLVVENANIGWATLQVIIDRGYKNLYYTPKGESYSDVSQQVSKSVDLKSSTDMVAGFTTSSKTRPLIIAKLDTYMSEKSPVIRSKRLIEELFVFIWKGSRAEAQEGYNDDLVMSFAIALWLRDTAIKLKQKGKQLQRKTLEHMGKNTSHVYTRSNYNGNANPWKMNTGVRGVDLDLTEFL